MKKSIITVVLVLCGVFSSSAQELKPGYAKAMEKFVSEMSEVMGMDEDQLKSLTDYQKNRFLKIQEIAEVNKPGTDEFKAKVGELNTEFNKYIVEATSVEQRQKWQAHLKEKKANK